MTTPLRKQYLEIKRRYPGAILLFQVGDFYETFDEDAVIVSRELGIVLTRKTFGASLRSPLAGIPVRSLEHHIGKLLAKGYRIAICDQLTLPGKGLVDRDVVRIITPGTVVEPGLLDSSSNNYLASFVLAGNLAGIAYVDITTGEFAATQLARAQSIPELERLSPSEIIVDQALKDSSLPAPATVAEAGWFDYEAAESILLNHFGANSLSPYGCQELPLAVRAAGALIAYLRQTQPEALTQLARLSTYSVESFMALDQQALRNLEVFEVGGPSGGSPSGSLLSVIDATYTPMGGRLLRKWLRYPLLDINELNSRQGFVEWFFHNADARAELRAQLAKVSDVERLFSRTSRAIALPAELVTLAQSLSAVPQIRSLLEKHGAPSVLVLPLQSCDEAVSMIRQAITDSPPSLFEKGGIIRDGFSPELDELRSTLGGGKKFLAELERRERERTGIRSLKVSYNKVFGYYIEVTKPNLHLVPTNYIRKQTLTNAERFFTLELKEYESLVANARERLLELETSIFRQVCHQVGAYRHKIAAVASALARLDLFSALAEVAARHSYARPTLTEGDEIEIVAGRHPMVERGLKPGEFVANDTRLSNHDSQIIILTGPNMSGKSTYLRQVALICLLAQIGSYVPAERATLCLIDRIFTRVGLHDYVTRGQSSFMVEMIDTAHILNHATPRSLVLLDEIGRGTSTTDGLSIARSVIEYIHNHPRVASKALIATHFHELTECAEQLPRARNYHVAVREQGGKVTFLHRIEPGKAEKSFGLFVAQLAGLPRAVIHRAQELLAYYEGAQQQNSEKRAAETPATYCGHADLLEELQRLDINSLTPVEALTKLYALQKKQT